MGRKGKFSDLADIKQVLDYVDEKKLYPDIYPIESAVDTEVLVNGKKNLMFTSNNYLGLATHPKMKKAAIEAIEKYGVGSTGSRLLSGNLKIHIDLERKLAELKGGEAAIVFPSGFATNLGTISGLMNIIKVLPSDFLKGKSVILSDELNHASIIDGCRQSKQKVVVYKHVDMRHLEELLKKFQNKRKLIVTDSIFSMDGDIAPLDKIAALAKKYNSMVMIDEAHAIGVLGENNMGAKEHFHLKTPEDITITMGTLSKAVSSMGGYIVGSKELTQYLRVAARPYMFSTAMLPAASAGAIAALEIMSSSEGKALKKKLWENVAYMSNGLKKIGFDTMGSCTQIIPILIGSDQDAITATRMYFDHGILAPCVRWPAVPKNTARIRLTVTSNHTKKQIDTLLNVSEAVYKKLFT